MYVEVKQSKAIEKCHTDFPVDLYVASSIISVIFPCPSKKSAKFWLPGQVCESTWFPLVCQFSKIK